MDKARLFVTAMFATASMVLGACGSSNDSTTSASANTGAGGSNAGGANAGGANAGGSGEGGDGTAGGGTGGGAVQSGLSKVGTGEYEVFFLVDGVIYGYGASAGTLGMGTFQGLAIPARTIDTPMGLKFIDVQGGLHQSMGIDENHKVWTWGDTNDGRQGSGVLSGADATVPFQIQTDADGNAFDHVVAIEPTTNFNAALKDDGSVWLWGNCATVLPGGDAMTNDVTKPTKVALPAGVKITKFIGGAKTVLALASDGSVWIWGQSEDGMSLGTGHADSVTPTKVTGLPANIKEVAAGYSSFYYALTTDGELYGWGYRWLYLGLYDPNNSYAPQLTPKALKSALKLPKPVAQVSADHMSTHVILTDGTLWGWGDDAMGVVGDGQELDYVHTYNCAWDFSTNLWVYHPVQIAPDAGQFAKIWSNSAYDFYDYAMTVDGKLYSWGRNKTGIVGNGVYPLSANGNVGTSSDMSGTYPNSWDVTKPTLVDPLHVTPKGENSPCCVANPTAKDCGG